ncbi:MAG: DUF4105 domain-containing protein [Flavobacteriales bacterium]|nr:DUF4105 domain-containing protein [Flavobacteriales bacterium]
MVRASSFIAALMLTVGTLAQSWSPDTEVSLLTCTPGDELYSAYGHSAIRIHGDFGNKPLDLVYNYGTFEFNDGFIWRFTRGKLDYMLSRSQFPYFQQEYIFTNRGIREQVLDLDADELNALFTFLEDNYLPENRYYRYDFFYDNCATRVRDALHATLGESLVWKEETAGTITFRELIDGYQEPWPWTDFGIDIALGLPCDKVLEKGDDMFLPDYLFDQFSRATLDGEPLVKETRDLLLREQYPSAKSLFTPTRTTWAMLALFMLIALGFRKRSGLQLVIDRFVLIFLGLAGCFLIFLWFFTDHQATASNFNLLWAMPAHLIAAFAMNRKWTAVYFKIYSFIGLLVILSWAFLPQDLHSAALPLSILGTLVCAKRSIFRTLWGNRG